MTERLIRGDKPTQPVLHTVHLISPGSQTTPDGAPKLYDMEMVRGVVINSDGNLLVMQKGPFSKTAWEWEFTGGSTIGIMPAKPAKLIRELMREMREETTLVPRPDQIDLIDQPFEYNRPHHGISSRDLVHGFIVRLDRKQSKQKVRVNLKENLIDFRWISQRRLEEMYLEMAGEKMRISPNSEMIVSHLIANPQLLAA